MQSTEHEFLGTTDREKGAAGTAAFFVGTKRGVTNILNAFTVDLNVAAEITAKVMVSFLVTDRRR
jgi:hypothetical protein